ncbi:hypothetical protein BVH55_00035 (plasmid) [Bacillus velezensis]|nr:hypothetical protein BVH55_00035 [Bacillus velezensis]
MEYILKALICSIVIILAFGGIFGILCLTSNFIGYEFVPLASLILVAFFCSLIYFIINDKHK